MIAALATAALSTAAVAPADAASVKGKWRGTITLVKGGPGSFPLVMKITKTQVGKRGGTISIPGSPCRGTITLKSRKGPKYLFQYHEQSKMSRCTGDDKVTVSVVGGKLRWKGVSPDGGVVGKGRLSRVPPAVPVAATSPTSPTSSTTLPPRASARLPRCMEASACAKRLRPLRFAPRGLVARRDDARC